MAGAAAPAIPPPTDYTGVMVNASNNQLVGQLAQTATQQLLGQLMAFNQSQQIMTNGQTAMAGIDAKLDIARLNFQLAEEGLENEMREIELTHEEKMEELDVRRTEAERPVVNTESTDGFLT